MWENFFGKCFQKKVYKVTCPTISTYQNLKNLKIFSENKLEILYDPILSAKDINKKKNEQIEKIFKKNEFILGIGRLTKQKNFQLLIRAFSKISMKMPNIKLVILGEGEERDKLEKLAIDLKINDKVFLIGHKSNVFSYLYRTKCFISSSLYEDPGFAIIEAGFLNKLVLAADSKTGPSEILDMSNRGILFENKNYENLVEKFFDFINLDEIELNRKAINLKKYSKNFASFTHFTNLRKILVN